jgi:hypothetical protein
MKNRKTLKGSSIPSPRSFDDAQAPMKELWNMANSIFRCGLTRAGYSQFRRRSQEIRLGMKNIEDPTHRRIAQQFVNLCIFEMKIYRKILLLGSSSPIKITRHGCFAAVTDCRSRHSCGRDEVSQA